MTETVQKSPRIVGRYAVFDPIAAGGMATVHLGRLLGEVGFTRTVAIKRLHAQFTSDPDFVSMFIDEARLAARVRHPNVVQTVDVCATDDELFVVMDYIEGESLARMFRKAVQSGRRMDPKLVARIMVDTLHGLHAAHEAKNEAGEPLDIVHRDVSPQNVLVGVDGIARVLDFGIAKAVGQLHTTREGELKGKLAYMAPEQLLGQDVTRRTDVFAASIMFWELLVGQRLFGGMSEGEIVRRVLEAEVTPPSRLAPELPPGIDAVVMRGLARDPSARHASAAEFAEAIEALIPLPPARALGAWVREQAEDTLANRARLVSAIESTSLSVVPTAEDSKRIAARSTPSDPATDLTAASQPTSISTRHTTGAAPRRWQARVGVQLGVFCIVVAALGFGWRARRTTSTGIPTAGASTSIVLPVPSPSAALVEPPAVASAEPTAPSASAPSSASAAPHRMAPAPRIALDPKPRAGSPSSSAPTGQRLYTRD